MSDRGSAFHSWKGVSRFEALLEEYEVDHYLAKEAQVNGKAEALNASFEKELVRQTEMVDLADATQHIRRWVRFYNYERTHHALGGPIVSTVGSRRPSRASSRAKVPTCSIC